MGEEKKNKPEEGETKTEDQKTEEPKTEQEKPKPETDEAAGKDDAPPPPPPEIVMRVYMHCEGCARKVRRCLKGFDGVEEVVTDCRSQKVVVKGPKADPRKVMDRVQKKTHRQVELLSPLPKVEEEEKKKKVEEEEKKKDDPKPEPQEIKQEPKVITVVIKVHMHCEACSLEIKRRIEKMKEVEEAIPDLISSTVSVKGTFDPPKLIDYVYKRTGKHASVVQITPPPPEPKDDGNKGKVGKDENKSGGEDGKKEGEKNEEGDKAAKAAGPDKGEVAVAVAVAVTPEEVGEKAIELKRNEYNYYPPRYGVEMYAYPPQIFSDENPNACSIM